MGRKLVLGVITILAAVGVVAITVGGVEWWQRRGPPASQVAAAPASPTTAVAPVVTVPVDEGIAAGPEPGEAMCPFSDTPVPAGGECPDDRPPQPSPEMVEREERRQQRAEEDALLDAEIAPVRQDAWELARAERLPDALQLIDAELAAEAEMCETDGNGYRECRIVGTLDEWDAASRRFDALRELRCKLLVDAGIVSECWALPTLPPLSGEGLSHPKVQADARALLEDVVAAHGQQWPWLRAAWGSSEVVFYDSELPQCAGVACVLTGWLSPMMLFTLDVVDTDVVDAGLRVEVLTHELAHVWADTAGGPARAATDLFTRHYAGCYTSDLSSERFVNELLADAVVVVTLGLDGRGYGYYGLDFEGCLVEGPPPEALTEALRASLSEVGLNSGAQ